MTPVTLINGLPEERISTSDRGLAYGHGVFETLLVKNGVPLFWSLHLERLLEGCARLGIPADSLAAQLEDDLDKVQLPDQGVIKIILTRGTGGRGYAVSPATEVTRIVRLSALPTWQGSPSVEGTRLRWCSTRLARQPLLAGIKHLNRLEQVLARAEWDDPEVQEGLVCDTQGYVVEGTMSNLFFVLKGRLCTPNLDQCGVAGILRRWVLETAEREGIPCEVGRYQPDDLVGASELFICNSLIGIWPVATLNGRVCEAGSTTRRLQSLLEKEYQAR